MLLYRSSVRKVLVTGMSGVGKSTVLAALESRGFDVVDTDEPGWTEWSDAQQGHVWREPRIVELLGGDRDVALFVSGTVSNQGRFYSSFDAVVLLSAPVHVLLGRIDARTTNDYGKTSLERAMILDDLANIEPLLRAGCTHELDAGRPLDEVVADLIAIASSGNQRR